MTRAKRGARIGDADEGAAGRKFVGDQKTAGAANCAACGRGFAISDEGDLVRAGRFERRDAGNFKIAHRLPRPLSNDPQSRPRPASPCMIQTYAG